ncbi:MAG: ethanolamine ammonia-lyase subunit EutC [Methylovirgula sp.]|jgi:ethanolamine ammonia-lyase small subunit
MTDPPRTPSDPWAFLRKATSARIALGRVGDGLPTARVLEFALAHARARDAVHTLLDAGALAKELASYAPIIVESRAQDRMLYLQRPDLGRMLADSAHLQHGKYDGVIVLADGLSARAVQSQGTALFKLLRRAQGWRFAPPVIARHARVALGDEIAQKLGADLVIMLVGERPGLSAADSLGAYITFAPKPGETRDADRNCISNIRPGGLTLEEAARRIVAIASLARKLRFSGTELKEDAALASLAPPEA